MTEAEPSEPTVLAFDTAAGACSAALFAGGKVQRREWAVMARGHAEALMPMITQVMGDREFSELDVIAVTVGPGAYTGLRIGLASARGLALATGVPLIGITSFRAVALGVAGELGPAVNLLVALETKRADIYLQALDGALTPLGEPACALPEDAGALFQHLWSEEVPVVVAGDAAERLRPALPESPRISFAPGPGLADAAIIAADIAHQWSAGEVSADASALRPLYLRPPDVTPPARDQHRLSHE